MSTSRSENILKNARRGYEFSNHLGNVLVTISGLPLGMEEGTPDNTVDYYIPNVLTVSDYEPFGAPLENRTASEIDGYRFGFNGVEKENNLNGEGNAYAFKYRMHDVRIGRFLSVDPLFHSYPWNSTYAFAENDVIRASDLEGLEKQIKATMATQIVPLPILGKVSCHTNDVVSKISNPNINITPFLFKLNAATPLAKDLIENYSFGNGKSYNLSEQDMKDVVPQRMGIQGISVTEYQRFETAINSLKNGESTEITWTYESGARQNGTLGNFTLGIWGDITKDKEGNWSFKGAMYFYDFWDFDPKPEGVRNEFAEAKVRFADKYLPGKPFHVTSDWVPIKQTSKDNIIDWFKNLPIPKSDNLNGAVQEITE